MKVSVSKYTLKPSSALNAKSDASERSGALLKFDFGETVGYADLFSWPELGEESLDALLEQVKKNEWENPNLKSSLLNAKLDAQARSEKHDLLAGGFTVENHCLVRDLDQFSPEHWKAMEKAGFTRMKVKVSKGMDVSVLTKIAEESSGHRFIRLDFNASLDASEFEDWCKHHKQLLECVEFVEDPCEDISAWPHLAKTYNLPIAADHLYSDDIDFNSVSHIVLKPSVQNPVEILKSLKEYPHLKFVVTHSMGHRLGQIAALAAAQRVRFMLKDRLAPCGLLQDGIYKDFDDNMTAWEQAVDERGPFVLPEDGVGLGQQELLEAQLWEPLLV